jgi:serine/threonine protein kinase
LTEYVCMDDNQRRRIDRLLSASPYRVVTHLGRGAVADVFVVRHEGLGKKFALKLLHPHLLNINGMAGASVVERLRREARTLGRIEHPHIVSVIDLAKTCEGTPYLVLELMEGHSLARELHKRGRFPISEALNWTGQALEGLDAAHSLGIVHRDVTPSNLFLKVVPDYERTLKVLDFGLARLTATSSDLLRETGGVSTKTGALIGSPGYASPEAIAGERVDQRADTFAVGLILYEMLSGEGPYDFEEPNYPPPSKYNSAISPRLDTIVMTAIEKDRTHRFQSAGDFLLALRPLLDKDQGARTLGR